LVSSRKKNQKQITGRWVEESQILAVRNNATMTYTDKEVREDS
jgi:hypothetical protein